MAELPADVGEVIRMEPQSSPPTYDADGVKPTGLRRVGIVSGRHLDTASLGLLGGRSLPMTRLPGQSCPQRLFKGAERERLLKCRAPTKGLR